jgi:hypothetical protein
MIRSLSAAGSTLLVAVLLSGCGGTSDGPSGPTNTDPTCIKPALTVGGTATGNTSKNVCKDAANNSGNFYTLTVTQTTPVTIAMTGNAFPGYVGLFYDNGQAIVQRNQNSPPLSIAVVLGPGTYTIIGSSLSGADGPYTLAVTPLALDACVTNLFATEGAVVTGTLTANSCADDVGNRSQSVTWSTRSAKTLAFTATLDKKAAVLFNGGAPNINIVGGPGTVTGSMPTQFLVAYNMAMAVVTHLSQFATLPISYTIKAE